MGDIFERDIKRIGKVQYLNETVQYLSIDQRIISKFEALLINNTEQSSSNLISLTWSFG